MDALHMVEFFVSIAAEVGEAVERVADRGLSGERPGQYTLDLRADEVVIERLVDAGFSVLSEESGITRPRTPVDPGSASASLLVVVDPIDGSTNASAGLPWFATSLCALDEHGPVAAVVVNQATGDRWHAIRGEGAWRNGSPITVGESKPLSESLVAVSGLPRSHFGWGQFRCYGAAALDLCAVADGTFDAFIDLSVDAHGVWDYLGGLLVLRESGGVIVDWHDRDLVIRSHDARRTPIAASSSELLAALRSASHGQHIEGRIGLE